MATQWTEYRFCNQQFFVPNSTLALALIHQGTCLALGMKDTGCAGPGEYKDKTHSFLPSMVLMPQLRWDYFNYAKSHHVEYRAANGGHLTVTHFFSLLICKNNIFIFIFAVINLPKTVKGTKCQLITQRWTFLLKFCLEHDLNIKRQIPNYKSERNSLS